MSRMGSASAEIRRMPVGESGPSPALGAPVLGAQAPVLGAPVLGVLSALRGLLPRGGLARGSVVAEIGRAHV